MKSKARSARTHTDCVLSAGLKVKLLLRDPARLPANYHDKVEIIQGNVVNMDDVERTISGVEGVAVVLGTRNNLGSARLNNNAKLVLERC